MRDACSSGRGRKASRWPAAGVSRRQGPAGRERGGSGGEPRVPRRNRPVRPDRSAAGRSAARVPRTAHCTCFSSAWRRRRRNKRRSLHSAGCRFGLAQYSFPAANSAISCAAIADSSREGGSRPQRAPPFSRRNWWGLLRLTHPTCCAGSVGGGKTLAHSAFPGGQLRHFFTASAGSQRSGKIGICRVYVGGYTCVEFGGFSPLPGLIFTIAVAKLARTLKG